MKTTNIIVVDKHTPEKPSVTQELDFQFDSFVGLTKPDTQCRPFKKRTLPFSLFLFVSFQVVTLRCWCHTLPKMDLPFLAFSLRVRLIVNNVTL